jgi:PEP-CTERM motif
MAKRITFLASVAILALGVVAASSAQAAYVVTFEEVGSNVVESGSGMLDPTDLTSTSFGTNEESVSAGSATYFSGGASAIEHEFTGDISGPASWGPGTPSPAFPSSSSGAGVGFEAPTMGIWVPFKHILFQPLSETSTYSDASFSSLGMTRGTYVYSWGTGAHADTFTVEIGVPEPSTWAMMLAGFAALAYVALRRKAAVPAM